MTGRQETDGAKTVELSDGRSLTADIVILATGIRPNLDLLQGSGIATGEAILVNDADADEFPARLCGWRRSPGAGPARRRRARFIRSQPTAVDHGRVAGANMAGQDVRYPGSLLMNVVDICGLQGASFGRWDDAAAEVDHDRRMPAGFILPQAALDRRPDFPAPSSLGRANDLGMLTDIGMVKGLIQTGTRLGPWKKSSAGESVRHPPRVRWQWRGGEARRHGAAGPSRPRRVNIDSGRREPKVPANPAHAVFVAKR